MKKYKNLVIGGIENKVFNLILITIILLTVAFVLISSNRSKMLSHLTAETSVHQQEATSEIISATMDQVTQKSMERTTEMEAQLVDEMFCDIQARVMMVSDYAAKIYANPDNFSSLPYKGPDASLNGRLVSQIIWADSVDPEDPEMVSRAGLISNLSELMVSSCEATGSDNIFVGTEEGIFLSINRSSADWFDQDGNILSFDARTRFWYKQAAEAGELVFSDLEVDATTGEMSVVCAMPVYNPNGERVAVVGSDLFLHAMETVMTGFISDGGYSWIVNQDGHVIFSPNPEVLQVNASANATDLRISENKELSSLVNDAMEGRADVRVVSVRGEDYYMLGIPIETVGWTLFSAFPKETIDQVEVALLSSYDQITNEARSTYQGKITQSGHVARTLIVFLTIMAIIAAIVLGKRIVNPLNTITKQIASLNEQNSVFKMQKAYYTGDEIQVLAESFAKLSSQTVQYIEEVKRVTAEKERIGTELHMARRIQESVLPNIFPPFPNRSEFDLFASMDAAREVGGDFYDYYLIDDDHLCLVIADVSGKGVPAALFMMISKVILQSCAMLGQSAVEILSKMNQALCSNNQVEMFVTVWLGILEISTGKMTCANAAALLNCTRTAMALSLADWRM